MTVHDLCTHAFPVGARIVHVCDQCTSGGGGAGFLVEGRERQKLLYDGVRYDTWHVRRRA
ncbi:hypothetical protein ACFVDI_25340 [Nocardioides sp. NPDC057767]|uniref:hypothetical protein n=1 Tax=unclassified Nocardioides TaxID=2615069 RepID=UPI00366F242A